jgi:tetratricopeptide (TPR) repeat protein
MIFFSRRNLLLIFVFCLLALNLFGCSSSGSIKSLFKEDEYAKMMKMQRERQNAFENQVEKSSDTLPEMTEEAYEKLGDYHLSQGNIDMAYIQYDKALKLKPEQVRIRYKLGTLYLKRALYDKAETEFKSILSYEPDYAFAHYGLGRVYFNRGNLEEAERSFREAKEQNSDLWQAHVFLGIIHDRRHNFNDAIEEYQRAASIKPDNADILNNLAISYYLNGEYENAVNALSNAVKVRSPKNGIYYNNLGLALCKLGKYDEALDAFRRSGDEAAAYNNIGYILMIEGKYAEAIKVFEKALEDNSTFFTKANENLLNAKAALDISHSEQ